MIVVTGQLGATRLEGGGVYVRAPDGTRYEPVWPAGWTADPTTASLIAPSGEIAARGGDTITIRGELAPELSSIRQMGPILRVVEVVAVGA